MYIYKFNLCKKLRIPTEVEQKYKASACISK